MHLIKHTTLDIRPARNEELEELLVVLCASFNLNLDAARALFYEDPLFQLDHKWIASDGKRIVSTLTLIPVPMRVGNAIVSSAGIAGVATHPDFRSMGYASALLEECLRQLPKMGYVAAGLIPVQYGFYRRFGFEMAATTTSLRLSPASLPRYIEGTDCRRMNVEDEEDVKIIHEASTKGRTGIIERDETRWRFLFWNNRQRIVWGNPVQAYLIYELGYDQETILKVREMFWSTDAGRRGVIGFLGRNEERAAKIEYIGWHEDVRALSEVGLESKPNDPNVSLIEMREMPSFMWRIVDFPGALRAISSNFPKDMPTLTLQVDDPALEWNRLPVVLPSLEVLPSKAKINVQMDIQTFSQLHLGLIDPGQAYASRLLKADTPQTLETLQTLFPLRHPSMLATDQF
jgi:predicted acetyltransferase